MNATREQVRVAVSAMYQGDEDRAAELLAGIAAGPAIDAQSVVNAATDEIRLAEVKERLQSEFPSAFEDPDVAIVADRRFHAHVANGMSKPEAAERAAQEAIEKLRRGRSNAAPQEGDAQQAIAELRRWRGQTA